MLKYKIPQIVTLTRNAYLLTVDMPKHQKIFSPTEYLK